MKPYLKETRWGHKVVYPIKNEDGSINWKHFLIQDWGRFIRLCFILGLLLFMMGAYKEDTKTCRELIE